MSENPAPVELEIDSSSGRVRIKWDDGHESIYPVRYLRGFCPCALCQGHSGMWSFIPIDAPRVLRVEEVGSYALNIIWDDGAGKEHTTGIYSFETLRELCPCKACLKERGAKHLWHQLHGTRPSHGHHHH